MTEPLLEVRDLAKRFGGFVALDAIALTVAPGERLGLIGPNGSGKSTLVNCLCGTLRNESGSVRFEGEIMDGLAAHQRTRLGMARSFQLPRPFHSLTVADNLRVPLLYTVNARHGRRLSPAEVDVRIAELLGLIGHKRLLLWIAIFIKHEGYADKTHFSWKGRNKISNRRITVNKNNGLVWDRGNFRCDEVIAGKIGLGKGERNEPPGT